MAAFGTETRETDPEYVRAFTGALLFAEAMNDLRQIRRALAPKKS